MANQLMQRLRLHALQHGDAIAIREISREDQEDRSVTFSQLLAMTSSLARSIASTLNPGDVIIISLPNRISCTVSFLAALQARMVGFLINPNVADRELHRAAQVASAKAFIGDDGTLEILDGLGIQSIAVNRDVDLDAIMPHEVAHAHLPFETTGSGLMLLSSGTTGEPKIVYRDGPSLDAVARNIALATKLRLDDRVLGLVPLCHSYGVEHGILAPTYAGCTVHLCQGFDTHTVLDQLRSGAITVLPGVPSVFEMLAQIDDRHQPFPSLRCAYSAGSQLPQCVIDACRQRLQLSVGQLYGSSEVGSVTFNDPDSPGGDAMGVGLPMEGVTIKIVDPDSPQTSKPRSTGVEGEVAIHAPSMLKRYVNHQATILDGGYFLTGDLGCLDAKGALTITGRLKLLIDVGALKVNPLEVEAVLCEHPEVRECAVLSLPVTETISRVRAVIVPIDLTSPPPINELRNFVRDRLSAHKVPRVFEIVSSLPKSPTGKILRLQIA